MTQTNDASVRGAPEALPLRARRRLIRVAHEARNPESLADARGTVDARHVVDAKARRARWLGVPLAVLGVDVAALGAQALLVGGGMIRALLFAGIVLVVRAAVHQYRPRLALSTLDDLPRNVGTTLGALGLSVGIEYATGRSGSATQLLHRAGVFLAAVFVGQVLVFVLLRRLRRAGFGLRRTLVIGAGRVGTTLAVALREHPELGLVPVGFADPEPSAAVPTPLLTTDLRSLPRVIAEHEVDTAILAFRDTGEAYVDTIMAVHQTGCSMLLVPSMFELHHDGPDVERVRGIPLLRLRPDPTMRPTWWVKRGFDVVVGALGLLVLAVPFVLIALAILITSGRPVLFWQERIGLDGRPFRLCKFRSMRPESEHESATTWSIGDDPRVGRFGRLLRKSSVDELPQLWNILRGQMSVVGPRPERPSFVRQFSAEHERYWARHRVPVGLTGLAQVSGLRGDTSIRERARYDNYYIANWSLWLDVKIMLLTVREVLGGHGR